MSTNYVHVWMKINPNKLDLKMEWTSLKDCDNFCETIIPRSLLLICGLDESILSCLNAYKVLALELGKKKQNTSAVNLRYICILCG